MKNYIANDFGGWATSSGYMKHSFARSIHFGRVYTSGAHGTRGKEADLCEALRCLGQGLHCLEDFGAHTNYTELSLRELGFTNVFSHTGTATQLNVRGKQIFPLVTGTFGGVDFLHSVLGEATDHFTQSEVDQMNAALGNASGQSKRSVGGSQGAAALTDLLSRVPGTGALCQEAHNLQAASDAQAAANSGYGGSRALDDDPYSGSRASGQPAFAAPPGSTGGPPGPGIPGLSPTFDPQATIAKIYPILEFRDKVVRAINSVVSKIPGLEDLIDKITERVTLFVMSLLAPYVQPVINAVSQQLKQGSSAVIESSGRHQYEPWTDPHCTDPTHSLLSKDHFSNVLNEPAGQVAAAVLQYVAPRVVYAWDNPDVPVDEVLDDVARVFHHPALRDHRVEIHRAMFAVVERWARSRPDGGAGLNDILSSDSVRSGRNQQGGAGAVSASPFDAFGGTRGGFGDEAAHPPPQSAAYGLPGHQAPPAQSHDGPHHHHQQQAPPLPAGPLAHDPYAFPTAYQQGYEVPYAPGQQAGLQAHPYQGYGAPPQQDPSTQAQPGGWFGRQDY